MYCFAVAESVSSADDGRGGQRRRMPQHRRRRAPQHRDGVDTDGGHTAQNDERSGGGGATGSERSERHGDYNRGSHRGGRGSRGAGGSRGGGGGSRGYHRSGGDSGAPDHAGESAHRQKPDSAAPGAKSQDARMTSSNAKSGGATSGNSKANNYQNGVAASRVASNGGDKQNGGLAPKQQRGDAKRGSTNQNKANNRATDAANTKLVNGQ